MKIVDKRSSGRTGQKRLITGNLQSELSSAKKDYQRVQYLKRQGLPVPKNKQRAIQSASNIGGTVREHNLGKLADIYRQQVKTGTSSDAMSRIAQEMKMNRMSKMNKTSDLMMALPKEREPLQSLRNKGIPIVAGDPREREQMRSWAAAYYATHQLIGIVIDIYAQFPCQGVELQCKDEGLKKFYEQLFFQELEYETYLPELGKAFWLIGEYNSLGSFNETLGVWDDEELLNADDIEATFSPFQKGFNHKLRIPAYLQELIDKREPGWEYQKLVEDYPEIITAAQRDEGLDISNVLLSRGMTTIFPSDAYGTPRLLRNFSTLLSEESLNAAQDAVADRLYAPFIMAKLGLEDAGDGEPWIPDSGEIQAFRDDVQMAFASDFRFLAHHFGVEMYSVFGREAMPRFDDDYDRIERKILQAWGIGPELVSGGATGTYASSALNREFISQAMTIFQKQLVKHYKKRAEVVAEAQEHYDYETSGGIRVPIMQEVLQTDEETGEQYIVKKPKLLYPDLHFRTLNLRDETVERAFLTNLRQLGVPISDEALMVNIPFEYKEQIQKNSDEQVMKWLASAEAIQKTVDLCKLRGLPLPPDLMTIIGQQAQVQAQIQQMQLAAQTAALQGMNPENVQPPDIGNIPDLTMGQESNNPQNQQNMAQTAGGGITDLTKFLPQNQIAQRPEISNEMRATAPKVAKLIEYRDESHTDEDADNGRTLYKLEYVDETYEEAERRRNRRSSGYIGRITDGPRHVGMSAFLTPESIQDAINSRHWAQLVEAIKET